MAEQKRQEWVESARRLRDERMQAVKEKENSNPIPPQPDPEPVPGPDPDPDPCPKIQLCEGFEIYDNTAMEAELLAELEAAGDPPISIPK